jgi:xylan 1,4-beta-xylosidase
MRMKKLLFATCCIAFLSGSLGAAAQKKSAAKNVLTQTLKGKSWSADNGNGTFTNPLFYDEFSDPDHNISSSTPYPSCQPCLMPGKKEA